MISYYGFATSLFGGLVDKFGKQFGFLKESLPKAGIKVPFRTYLSATFLSSIVMYFVSILFLTIVFMFLSIPGSLKFILYIYMPVMLSIIMFIVLIFLPYQKMNGMRRSIDTSLPFALIHMGAISESGVPPYMIFKLMSKFEEYGELSREMKLLVRNIDVFGIDPVTAIKEAAERTPSAELRQLLLGVISTSESGGDIKTYIKNAGDQALFNWKLKREKFMQQLSAYAEFYTGILIAAPLFIIALFAVMSMIQPNIGGFDILTLTKLSIYAFIPILNVGFILFLRGVEVEI